MFLVSWTLQAVSMADETQEIAALLASTGSEIYTQIGRYLEELEFTADILDDEDGDFSDLFAEDDDCRRIGIPLDDGVAVRDFIVSRTEQMILDYSQRHKSRRLLLMAERLRDALFAQNAAVYREIGRLLFEYQVHCGDIAAADSLKLYLSSADLVRIGLKNKAKQKLAFAKVMRLIQEIQKQPEITEELKVDDAPKSMGSEPVDQSETNGDDKGAENESESKEDDSAQILREMLNIGTINATVFWSYFFKEVKWRHFVRSLFDRKFAASSNRCGLSMDSKNG